jgi:hypothetical protein
MFDKFIVIKKKQRRKTLYDDNSRKYSFSGKLSNKFITARDITKPQNDDKY